METVNITKDYLSEINSIQSAHISGKNTEQSIPLLELLLLSIPGIFIFLFLLFFIIWKPADIF